LNGTLIADSMKEVHCMARHILRSQQYDREALTRLFKKTGEIAARFARPEERRALRQLLDGRLLFNIFYEPSTRTRMSFGAAARNLGMRVETTESAGHFSSAIKGETVEDTMHVLCAYGPDAIVLRHNEAGAAARAAAVCEVHDVPIINAGDGTGQHPTQALLDLFTIYQHHGAIDDKTIVLGGDLAHGRTARSLVYLLSKYPRVRLIFVAPVGLKMRGDILDHLREHEIAFREETQLEAAFPDADVVYWTRVQKERLPDPSIYPEVANVYTIGVPEMGLMRDNAILMHPLPRVNEIKPEVDSDPRAVYFSHQVRNGMLIRMALLLDVSGVAW
jgi:aspartate carbamoyltransferase catalytic subunit